MASKVSGIIEKINTSGTSHAIASTAYGVCDTAANEQYKNVDMTGFKLEEGVTIHVKFNNTNSADNPMLKFNGEADTNAKPIVQYGTTAVGKINETTGWNKGAVLTLTYDGTSWVRDQGFNTNDSVSQSASTTASWRKILLSNNTYAATDTAVEGTRGIVYEAVGVSVQPSTGTLHATTFEGTLNGNASSATQTKVTSLNFPSSGSQTYYPTLAGSTTTGNQDIKDSAHLYLWENTTSSYLNIGSSGTIGAISLWNGTGHVNIIPTTLTANATLTLTLPNASGTVALMSNLNDYLPLTGGRVTDNITLYTSGTDASPALVFQCQDTIGGDYYDWRIRNTGGQLYFEDIGTHTSNAWTMRFKMYTDTLTGKFSGDLTGNASTATLLQAASNKINDVSTTIGESGWNSIIPTGSVKVWSQKFINTGLKYNNNGTDTSVTDAGNIVMWLTPGETTDAASLCMCIDGTIQSAGFIGNASSATKLQTARELYVDLGTTHDTNNKVTFDGSEDKVLHVSGTLPIGRGGTGKTSANDAANALLSGLPTSWTATPLDDTAFIRCATNSSTTFGRAPFSTVWTYINNKVGAENGGFTGIPKAPTAADGTNTTQIATTAFVQNTLKYANALIYKGTIAGAEITEQAPGGALTGLANCGDTYKVSAAGFINGLRVEVGDMLICMTDNTPAATTTGDDIYTTVRANWNIIQTSEGTVSSSSVDSTDNALAIWDNTSGRIIKNQSTITYIPATDAELGSTKGKVTGLFIIGSAYGNTAENLGSNKKNVFTYGDPGPQIRFGTQTSASELGAIIWSNNSNSNNLDSAFYFVGRKDINNTEATVGVVTKVLVARTRLMVGSDYSNTSYVAYLNGATYINGTLTLTSDISGTGSIQIKTNTASSTITTATFQGASIIPGTGTSALARYLGSSTYPWKNVYAETFTGDLSGTATTAEKITITTTTNLNSFYTNSTSEKYLKYTAGGGSNNIDGKPSGVTAFGCISFKCADGYEAQILASTLKGLFWRQNANGSLTTNDWKNILDSNNTYAADSNGNAISVTCGTPVTLATINGTAVKINITAPSYSDVGAASSDHVHGNITSGGCITTAITKAENDYLIIGDNSDSGKIGKGPVFCDAISSQTTSSKFLREDGSWAAPNTAYGNVSTAGAIGKSSGWTLANKDQLVVADESNSWKMERSGIAFDGSTETQCLTKKGTWKTFGTSNLTIGTTSGTAMAGNTVVNKVKTTVKSDNIEYKILGNAAGASPTSESDYEAIYDTNITMNPSTSTITANTFTGTILKLNVLTGGDGTVGGDKGSDANPRYVPSKWYFNAGIIPANGDIITIKVPVAGSDRGVYLSVDNQTTYYPVIYNTNSYITTHFGANACITLYFDSSITTKMYALNGQNNTTTSNVTGAWRVLTLYDSGNTNNATAQNYSTTNNSYPLLFSNVAGITSTSNRGNKGTILTNTIYANPSTGIVYATGFNGSLTGNVTGTADMATADADGNTISSTYFKLTETRAATTSNTFSITNSTASTSTSVGALVVSGGIATGADSYLSKSVHFVGAAADNPVITRGISGSDAYGNIGDTAANKELYLNYNGGCVYVGFTETTADSTNMLKVAYISDSNSTSTGALVVNGGVGIAKKLYVGSSINSSGNITISKDTGSIIVHSTNSTTASIVLERHNGTNIISSWKWVNSNGTLTLQNNWTSGTYFNVVTYSHTSGDVTINQGTFSAPYYDELHITSANQYKHIYFSPTNPTDSNKNAATISYNFGTGTTGYIGRGNFRFRAYSPQSTQNATHTGFYEEFTTPTISAGLTENKSWTILTTKSTVTVEQGGTGTTSFTADCAIVGNGTSAMSSKGLKITGATDQNITLEPYTAGKTMTVQSSTAAMTVSTTTGTLTIQTNTGTGTSGGNLILKTVGNAGTVTLQSTKSSVSISSGTTMSINSTTSTSISATTTMTISSTTSTSISATTTMSISGTQGTTINSGNGYATVFKINATEYGRFNTNGMFQLNSTGTQSTHKLYVNGDSAFNGKIAFGAQSSNTITNKAYMQWNATDLSIDFIFA